MTWSILRDEFWSPDSTMPAYRIHGFEGSSGGIGLISSLATAHNLLDYILESKSRFLRPRFECFDVDRILGEALPHRLVDEIRNASVSLGGLQTERALQGRIEIDHHALRWPHRQGR